MKKDELIAIGVKQYSNPGSGDSTFRARKFTERVDQVMRDWGEGFAVFVGSSLSSFGGDVGAARNDARKAVPYAGKNKVTIKHVKV